MRLYNKSVRGEVSHKPVIRAELVVYNMEADQGRIQEFCMGGSIPPSLLSSLPLPFPPLPLPSLSLSTPPLLFKRGSGSLPPENVWNSTLQ